MPLIICIVAVVVLTAVVTFLIVSNADLKSRAADADRHAAAARQEAEQARSQLQSEIARIREKTRVALGEARGEVEQTRLQMQSEIARIRQETQAALAAAQKLVDEQSDSLAGESARVRQHYINEARRIETAASTRLAEMRRQLDSLKKYESLQNAEENVRRELEEALKDANLVRGEANRLLESARAAGAAERAEAKERVRQIHEQADARLDQAIRDAGRIIKDAETRAQEIGGDAYTALQDKRQLEEAAQAMRNIIEGYGDRYLVPTHSLLDDLAAEYGYDAAAQSLASAREQSRRMVDQGQAATCDYAETARRNTAIQFVTEAFNGKVDAILSRTKADNYGVLEQQIRDHFAVVNHAGSAFRKARILPEYLDARLAELKWAVVVQELAARDREEQRYLKEQERDRQKAEQERQRQLREAQREEELKRAALAQAEAQLAQAHHEERAKLEAEVQRLKEEVADATRRELTIAQQTDKGRIYVISNIGSFGEGVYKIGLTRRQAQERVDELGGASVPFEFDIHAEIDTDDAPALEYKIHQQFLHARMNKINLRKEFFRTSLSEIRTVVDGLEQGKDFLSVKWTERAKAQQYYETLDIDGDPVKKEIWLKGARLRAERRRRELSVLSEIDDDADGDRQADAPPELAAAEKNGGVVV